MKDLFKKFLSGVGKAPSSIHAQNVYDQSQQKTATLGVYEKASEKLRPKTYVERKKKSVSFLTKLRSVYPLISVLLSLVTAYLVSDLFTDGLPIIAKYGLIVVVGGFTFLITVWVENEKKDALSNFFRVQNTDTTNASETAQPYLAVLVCTMVFSILVSATGGFFLTTKIQDKTGEIQKGTAAKIDSLNTYYANLITPLDAQIKAAQETIETKKGWWVNVAQTDMQNAMKTKTDLLEKQEKSLAKIESEGKATVLKSGNDTYKLALICALVVVFFELFYLYSFHSEYSFYAKAERENINHSILTDNGTVTDANATVTTANDLITALTQALTTANVPATTMANSAANVHANGQKIGFQFSNANVNANVNANEKGSNYWQTRTALCNDLTDKVTGNLNLTYTQLAQKHGVCEATVHRVKKSIFEL